MDRNEDPNEAWEVLKVELPARISTVYESTRLLHTSKLHAQRDARLWKALGEDGAELNQRHDDDSNEEEEEGFGGSDCNGDQNAWVEGLHNMVQSMIGDGSIVQNSPELQRFTSISEQEKVWIRTPSTVPKQRHIYGDVGDLELHAEVQRALTEVKRLQNSVNKIKLAAIEGVNNPTRHQGLTHDDERGHAEVPQRQGDEGPSMSVGYGASSTFRSVGEKVATNQALNREQLIAMMLVMEALDAHERNPQTAQQHLQYLGGEGGTGKSRVLQAIYKVFEILQQTSAIILTAASGAAATEIGGITIHSAVQLLVGQDSNFPRDRGPIDYKWMTRKMLVIDEISMLGCKDFHRVNTQLQRLRESSLPFGGLSVVLLSGDFMQFGPVLAKSILVEADQAVTQGNANPTTARVNEEAKALFKRFEHVILLEQQVRASSDPALRSLLQRIRKGEQTVEDVKD